MTKRLCSRGRSLPKCAWMTGLFALAAVLSPLQASESSLIWIQDPWSGESVLSTVAEPDYSLWDATQIKDYEKALTEDFPPALGILTIKDLGLQVAVFNGADDHTLDRGAGRIKGMAKMDGVGNLGISAHRDSFFRVLKDIEEGDGIMLQTAHGVDLYEVSDIRIVPKADVSALAKTDEKKLTLITCYPFYYQGHAPERLIVTAVPKQVTLE